MNFLMKSLLEIKLAMNELLILLLLNGFTGIYRNRAHGIPGPNDTPRLVNDYAGLFSNSEI
jgi:hypothetical protein